MNFFLKNRKLCCGYKNYFITDISVNIEYPGEHYDVLTVKNSDWQLSQNGHTATSALEGFGEITVSSTKKEGSLVLQTALKLSDDFTEKKWARLNICGLLPLRSEVFVYNPTDRNTLEMDTSAKTVAAVCNQRETGWQYMAFKGKMNGKKDFYGVLGFTTFNHYRTEVTLCESGEFCATSNISHALLSAGATVKSDKLFLYAERGNTDVLSAYGKAIAKENRIKEKAETPTGWCSWYYYGSNISQDTILENAKLLKENDIPVKYVQVDDGWQICYGEWEANDRFPDGMKALADNIRAEGFIPGIWIAPFGFAPDSTVVKEHPNWFTHKADGSIDPELFIDYSVKGARDWLSALCEKLTKEWGYGYLKIDLVTPKLASEGYKKSGFTAAQNFREAFKTIRKAVPEDTVILACTSPIGTSAGVADSLRVSRDIFERWESLKTVAAQTFKRYFVSEYIVTDPDCLMVRTAQQHDSDAFRICTRSANEIRTFITFISAAGGTLMLSDKLSLLGESDIAKIKTLFPINTTPAKPLDIFEKDIPSILYYGERNGIEMYALFNWEDQPQTLNLTFQEKKHVKCFYSGKEFAVPKELSLRLAPHTSEILYAAKSKDGLAKAGSSIMP